MKKFLLFILILVVVAVTVLLLTNHAYVELPSAIAATTTIAMAAASCFFSAFTLFVSVILFPPGFPFLWETLSSSRFVFTADLTGNISCLYNQWLWHCLYLKLFY